MFINNIVVYTGRGATTLLKNKYTSILYYGLNSLLYNVYDDNKSTLYYRWKKYYDKDLIIHKDNYPINDTVFEHASRSYLKGKNVDHLYKYHNKYITNVWLINYKINSDYPTQKPYKLMERIICLLTK